MSPDVESAAAQPRRRNARGDGQLLRGEILAAAAAILDETGSEQAVTLRAVARRAGIAAPSIYPHFRDPQAILLALVADAFQVLKARLIEARDAAGPDPADRMVAICEAYLDHAAQNPARYRAMFGGVWDARNAVESKAMSEPDAVELGQDVVGVLVEEISAASRAGRSASDDAFADTVAVWLAMHGLAQQRAVARYFPFPPDIFDRLVRPLLRLTP